MLLYVSLLGILMSVVLLSFNARHYRSSIYLGIFLLLVNLYGLLHYVLVYSGSAPLIAFSYLNFGFLHYLPGPMLYFYIRSLVRDNPALRRIDLLHFLPATIFLIISLPYIFTPWQVKLELAAHIADDVQSIINIPHAWLYEVFPIPSLFFARSFLATSYTIASVVMIVRFYFRSKWNAVFARQKFMIKWVVSLLLLSLIITVSYLLNIVLAYYSGDAKHLYVLNLLLVIPAAGLVGLAILPGLYPKILYGLPRVPSDVAITDDSPENERRSSNGSRLHLEADYMQSIGASADGYMKKHQPYLVPGFNLSQLSTMIQVPAHHLSYYFRQKEESFVEYRNRWRVEYAKALIKEGRANEMTLEGIGQLSGFNSRNTFSDAFRRVEGVSPQTFMTRLSKDAAV